MKILFLIALPLALSSAFAANIPDLCADAKAWQPQFGSPPVKFEKLADGSTCLVLSGTYGKAMDRLCWDYVGPLDLSQTEACSVEVSVDRPELGQLLGVYCGTPGGGWYARITGPSFTQKWQRVTWSFDDFTTEDKPLGWDQVDRFRFSLWGAGPGEITIRLRGFKAALREVHRNYLRNGSFEAPGPIPYGWGSGHWGVGNLPWAADMDLWRRHFALDRTTAHDGQCSLKLVNAPNLPRLQAMSVWFGLRDRPAPEYTLSAWLKADRADLPAALACHDARVTAKVGTQWQRVVLTGVKPGTQLVAIVKNEGEGTLWIDGVQLQARGQDTEAFNAHSGDAALVEREATVDWSAPRRTPDIAAGRKTTGPIQPAKVSIDANGRYLLDGKPYLMHSLGLEFISDPGMIDMTAAAGFPDLCIEVRASITTEELKSWFDRAAQVGLRVIPWLDGNIEIERFKTHITALRSHPALLCWYVYDEPSGDRFAEADRRLKLARELDSDHPALINYLGDKLSGHMGDIYSTDIYPIPHGSPLNAINGVTAMAAAAAPEHKPVWMWLQGTGYAYWMDREPTPRELSCMVYGSLIAGARGIYWFAQVPRSKECWDEMRAMCVELERLAPVLGSLDAAPQVQCPEPAVMVKSYQKKDETWVLAVNTRGDPCEGQFALPGNPGGGEVVFEGRKVSLRGGQWTDSFGPYERHVYRFAR